MEPKRYRSEYLIYASATPLTDGPEFSVTAWVTYPEGKHENDFPFSCHSPSLISLQSPQPHTTKPYRLPTFGTNHCFGIGCALHS